MKLTILTGVALVALMTQNAQAKATYNCFANENTNHLQAGPFLTHLGDSKVVISNEAGVTTLYGTSKKEGGVFYQKETIEFNPKSATGSLTISTHPKICGRGSCDPNGTAFISGKLAIDGVETYYNCNGSH